MKKYWSSRIKNQQPYVFGEQPKDKKYIKLNTNENPYPPSPRVFEAIQASLEELRLYPDPACSELVSAISQLFGIGEKNIFCGNGSDEILAMAFPAFFEPGRPILFPDITYTFYPVYADFYGLDCRTVPVEADFTIPYKKLFNSPGGVVLANPNAPTGISLEPDMVESIIKNNPDNVVIVDEAYVDFGGRSAVSLIDRYPNLLVVRTTSKSYSLAGLRVGWAMGNENLIAALNVVKNSFNSYTLGRPAIAGGAAALRDRQYFKTCIDKVIKTRQETAKALKGLGFNITPSCTNFLFVSHEKAGAEHIFKRLREEGILVRYFKKPRIDNWLRITIGTEEDMKAVVKKLEEILRTV